MRHKAIVWCSSGQWNAKLTPGCVQPRYSERGLLPIYCGPARLGCVSDVDIECPVRNANAVSSWYIPEWPSTAQPVFFCFFLPSSSSFSSSPSFSSVPPVLYHTVRELCLWKKRYRRRIYKSWRDRGVSPGSQPTNQIVTLSLYDFVLFYPFKWVHVNWMSSNFFAVVLGHATLQWVLCISYVFFSSIPTKETETKIYYIEYIHIWLENGIQEWAFTFMAMLNEILIL